MMMASAVVLFVQVSTNASLGGSPKKQLSHPSFGCKQLLNTLLRPQNNE
jgi:hypothetical protein